MNQDDNRNGDDRGIRILFMALFAITFAWLLLSLTFVRMDFDDGYTTIANTRYFLGESPDYFWQRGPLMALLLIPGEWLADGLGLHPLDVRPHHIVMVALHAITLVAVWKGLRLHFGANSATRMAWIAAMLTPVFFSYGAFISHDIFPGLLLLGQLLLAWRFLQRPTMKLWITLVVIGTLAPLIKHTYATIWIAVFLGVTVATYSLGALKAQLRLVAALALAAMLSGILTWCLYAAVLSSTYPDASWWIRPYLQAQAFVAGFQREGNISDIIYQWVYLKNWTAYGILAMCFVLPALVLSWRAGNLLQRAAVITWISIVVMMALIRFKEVRYLAYLAPITAIVLVPMLTACWQRRGLVPASAIILLAIGLGQSFREGFRIFAPYYRTTVTQFLAPLPARGGTVPSVVITGTMSFVSPEPYAFFGDRYHRVTHLNPEQIQALYGYPPGTVMTASNRSAISGADFIPGAVFVFSNGMAARVPPIAPDNRLTLQPDFIQLLAIAEEFELRLDGDWYLLPVPTSQPVMFLHAPGLNHPPLADSSRFPADSLIQLLGMDQRAPTVRALGFRIRSLCNIQGCQSF